MTEIRSEEFATEDEARRREKEIWSQGRPKYNQVSPFRTKEELGEYMRVYHRGKRRARSPEQVAKRRQDSREYMREYNRRPSVVERQRLRYLSKKYPGQAGPGLF